MAPGVSVVVGTAVEVNFVRNGLIYSYLMPAVIL